MVAKLLPLTSLELEQRIKEELEINPVLEEVKSLDSSQDDLNISDDDANIENSENSRNTEDFDMRDYMDEGDVEEYKLYSNNNQDNFFNRESADKNEISLQDYLLNQLILLNLTEQEKTIANVIIGNVDDNGYLTRNAQSIFNDISMFYDISTDKQKVENVVKIIQHLDPPGVAAADLKECLLLQLERKETSPARDVAKQIIMRVFEYFVKRRYEYIQQRLNISEDILKNAIKEIQILQPKPGIFFGESASQINTIVPDFVVVNKKNGDFDIKLNYNNDVRLNISKTYSNMLQEYSDVKKKDEGQKEVISFIKQKIDSAKFFIDALNSRKDTLLNTMLSIVKIQKDVFISGNMEYIKPMKLQDVANITGVDVSTVSRVVNSKYVETFFGIYKLKDFFSSVLNVSDGSNDDVSQAKAKNIIAKMIENEDKTNPLGDEVISKKLEVQGIKIARRTVSKYRENMGISTARQRREIS
ncbi:RNA polymerase sigma-54 factor [Bacteroidia bacterium]|nr:RNA polymerase sigma-54 factor [Bacteroidia bacterium]